MKLRSVKSNSRVRYRIYYENPISLKNSHNLPALTPAKWKNITSIFDRHLQKLVYRVSDNAIFYIADLLDLPF